MVVGGLGYQGHSYSAPGCSPDAWINSCGQACGPPVLYSQIGAATRDVRIVIMNCDVCNTDEKIAGVCSSALGPISFCYCIECALENAEPEFMFKVTLEMIGTEVAEHVKQCKTFKNGKYITWEEWINETNARK